MGTDRWAYASRLRKTDPMPKLCLSAAAVAVCLVCGTAAVGVLTLLLLAGYSIVLGGTRPGVLLRFFRAPLAFLVLGCATILVERRPLGSDMLLALEVGGSLWGLSAASLGRGIEIFCQAMGAVSGMYFLALTTPVTDLSAALGRLHVPRLFVELMELIYRFIFVLMEALERIRIAQASRLGYVGFRRSLESAGTLCSMVFLRAWRKGDRVYAALESRGYTGNLTTLPADYAAGGWLYALAAATAGLQLLVLWLAGP